MLALVNLITAFCRCRKPETTEFPAAPEPAGEDGLAANHAERRRKGHKEANLQSLSAPFGVYPPAILFWVRLLLRGPSAFAEFAQLHLALHARALKFARVGHGHILLAQARLEGPLHVVAFDRAGDRRLA